MSYGAEPTDHSTPGMPATAAASHTPATADDAHARAWAEYYAAQAQYQQQLEAYYAAQQAPHQEPQNAPHAAQQAQDQQQLEAQQYVQQQYAQQHAQQHYAQPHDAQANHGQPQPPPAAQQPPWVSPPGASYGALLGQTMLLVGLALAVMAAGALIGRNYSSGAALTFLVGGVGMLLAQNFVEDLRRGLLGTTWLFGLALAIGLGLGPTLSSYIAVNPDLVMQSALMTAVIVLGAACWGTFTSRDLVRWMFPVSMIVFVSAVGTWVMCAVGSGASPVLSAVVGLFSAVLIVIDFNYLRRRATEDDVIWLATGIFVSILNIFLSLLNLGD